METLNILVTGGAGFIGTNLVNELRERGHQSHVADLYHSEQQDFVRADVSNYRQVEHLFDDVEFDYVYYLAAEYGRWKGVQRSTLENLKNYAGGALFEDSRNIFD